MGTKYTPVRRVIDRAVAMIGLPKFCFSMVVKGEDLARLYIGTPGKACAAAADLSSKPHIVWVDKPFKRMLSVMPNRLNSCRIKVSLATRIPPERCAQVNPGYLNPDTINFETRKNREDERFLFVPKAGEQLYRVRAG